LEKGAAAKAEREMSEEFEFRIGDIVEWDSPVDYFVKQLNGIVVAHGPVTAARRGRIKKIIDPAPERERLLALLVEGKGYPLYGDWYNLGYVVESEGLEYCPSPKTHGMRLIERPNEM
jgi:hypothetical protein